MLWLFLGALVAGAGPRKRNRAKEAPPPAPVETPAPRAVMTNDGIHAFLTEALGEAAAEARQAPNQWTFTVERFRVMILTDERADRMRIMVPVADVLTLPEGAAERMLSANFDAVLDARYAIGRGTVWSTYIHPLSPLTDEQLASGLAQTITAAATFGTTFSSGALVFGGGDSNGLYEELLERLRNPIDEQGI